MSNPLFTIAGYSFGLASVANLVAACAALGGAVAALLRMVRTRHAILVFGFILATGSWLGASAMMYGAPTAVAARNWASIALLSGGVLGPLSYILTAELLRLTSQRRGWIAALAIGLGSLPFVVGGFELVIVDMQATSVGWYPEFHPGYGLAFAIFVMASVGASLAEWLRAYRETDSETAQYRASGFLVTLGAAPFGFVDFAGGAGLFAIPWTVVAAAVSLGTMGYTFHRFRVPELEPSHTGRNVLETMEELVFVVDEERRIRVVNAVVCEQLGWSESELLGRPFTDIASRSDSAAESTKTNPASWRKFDLLAEDGDRVSVRASSNRMASPEGEPSGFVIVAEQSRTARPDLPTADPRDSTTGLQARDAFLGGVSHRIEQSSAESNIAFCVVDLDRFKVINDTHGPRVGDRVLKSVGARLRRVLEDRGLVGRIGSDEFGVYLDAVRNTREVESLIAELRSAIAEPFEYESEEVFSTASVGYVIASPEEYASAEDVLQDAELALTNAKASSRIQTVQFDPEMYESVSGRLEIEHELRRALDSSDEIELHYQPIVSLEDEQIVGAEALARWHHPEHGWMSPGEFIPVAEETGLIVPLGKLLLDQAWRQAAEWQRTEAIADDFSLHFNLSISELSQESLLERFDELCAKLPLADGILQFEITERVLARSSEHTERALQRLRDHGIGLAIDDFGTGYSSLNYLRQFDPETLKIDRAFVRDVAEDSGELEIVRTVVDLSEKLEVGVIAEGIETAEQKELLESLGIELGQGFYWSRALAAPEFAAKYLQERRSEKVGLGESSITV